MASAFAPLPNIHIKTHTLIAEALEPLPSTGFSINNTSKLKIFTLYSVHDTLQMSKFVTDVDSHYSQSFQ